ncbi:MAG: nucleoside-diphosphate kinase [Candidatus Bipolaricaulia bacterium]
MAVERTFVMLKPDAVQRGLIGTLLGQIEVKGLKIMAMKMIQVDRELAEIHYAEHREKPFFEDLIRFVTSSPAVVMIVEGERAVEVVRGLMGATNPFEAKPGTIRGDFGLDLTKNLIHGSDSSASADRETRLFFDEQELLDYKLTQTEWTSG